MEERSRGIGIRGSNNVNEIAADNLIIAVSKHRIDRGARVENLAVAADDGDDVAKRLEHVCADLKWLPANRSAHRQSDRCQEKESRNRQRRQTHEGAERTIARLVQGPSSAKSLELAPEFDPHFRFAPERMDDGDRALRRLIKERELGAAGHVA